ncbi:MAG: hypothetical protein JWQ72_2637 [Polaromonas sp.]|nr:hypothetical protein [Polaromonas sp.]
MPCLPAEQEQQYPPRAARWRHLGRAVLAAPVLLACLPLHAQTRPVEPSLPYVVKASDKPIALSREMLVSTQAWNEVAKYNQLKNPALIFPGQKLDIPLRYLKSKASTGKVISAEGDVTLGGSPMQPGAVIADGSQFKTGANSSAVIELGDGSRIKLLPNSLAQVVTSRDYAMRDASASGSTHFFSGLLRLSSGTLEALASKSAKRATPLQIETPTSLVGVRGTEFRVAFDDPASNAARTEVIEGKVRADNPAQQSGADLPMGTGAVVKPAEREVKVVILLPAPDLAATPSEVLKPLGAWPMPVLAGATAYRVQVASDDHFDKIVRDMKIDSGNPAGASLGDLANGNWFARIRGIDAQGLEGFDTVKLIAVKDGQWRVSYSTMSLVGGQAVLGWVGVQADGQPLAGGTFSAVVARDEALSQVVVNADRAVPGRGPRLALGDLKPGVYYIRLRSALAQGGAMDSETYRFEIPANWGRSVFDLTSTLQAVR